MKSSIFRDRAENPVTSLQRVDAEMRLVRIPGWVALSVLLVVLVGGLVAMSVLQVSDAVAGSGILTRADETLIEAPAQGVVEDVKATVGDQVMAGEVVATLRTAPGNQGLVPVTSNVEGQVQRVLVKPANVVSAGDVLVDVAPPNSDMQATVLVSAWQAPRLQVGMPVELEFAGEPAAQVGVVAAQVIDVGDRPLTYSELVRLLHSQELASEIDSDGPVVAVVAAFPDGTPAKTLSGQVIDPPAQPGRLVSGQIIISRTSVLAALFRV